MIAFALLFSIVLVNKVLASYEPIGGYAPRNDVTSHAKLDLDQKAMEDAIKDGNFTAAYLHYSQGGNSVKEGGSMRTIQVRYEQDTFAWYLQSIGWYFQCSICINHLQ